MRCYGSFRRIVEKEVKGNHSCPSASGQCETGQPGNDSGHCPILADDLHFWSLLDLPNLLEDTPKTPSR